MLERENYFGGIRRSFFLFLCVIYLFIRYVSCHCKRAINFVASNGPIVKAATLEALETMTHKISGDEYIDRAVNFVISNFPIVKTATLEVLETLFAPKAMAKQLALVFVLETGVVRRGKNIFYIKTMERQCSSSEPCFAFVDVV